jgi:FdhD protein
MDDVWVASTLPGWRAARRIVRRGAASISGERPLAEETAISFAYQGAAYAVMMATPADLPDFAVGFTLTEGLVARATEIEAIDILPQRGGVVLRIELATHRAKLFWERRRHLAGPSGCGLCGIESLEEALRPIPSVDGELTLPSTSVSAALEALARRQALNRVTRSVHAAAFWHAQRGIIALREDVGRHNALDKLAGALAQSGVAAAEGALLLTSRVSVEMVQKAAMIGAPVVIAMSAPTTLAVRVAEAAGITLAAIARADGFEIFSHHGRFSEAELTHISQAG